MSFALVLAVLVFLWELPFDFVGQGLAWYVGSLPDGFLTVAPGDGAADRDVLAPAARRCAEFVALVPVPAAFPPAKAGSPLARLLGVAAEFPLVGGVVPVEFELVPADTDGDGGGVVLWPTVADGLGLPVWSAGALGACPGMYGRDEVLVQDRVLPDGLGADES